MTEPRLPRLWAGSSRRGYASRINRAPSPLRLRAVPIGSVLAGSLLACLPIMVSQPLLPPLGLMMMVAWRLLRPGIWPLWAGFFFGLFDDLLSGQPLGSGALLFSLIMIGIDLIDGLAVWRDYWTDWLVAALAIIVMLVGGLAIVGLMQPAPPLAVIVPQLIIAIIAWPPLLRIVAGLDRWRLDGGHG